jgi:hypothetical protein
MSGSGTFAPAGVADMGRNRWVVAVLWVVIAAVLGTDVFLLTARTRTTEVTLDDAVARFREEATVAPPATGDGETATSEASAAAATTGAGAAPPGAPAASTRSAAAARPRSSSSGPASSAPSSAAAGDAPVVAPSASEPAKPFLRPVEGVYRYRTTGGESISIAGARHDYPERTFATVRHLDGCGWTVRSDVAKEHQDTRTMCSEPGRLVQRSQGRSVEFFGQRDGVENDCDPGVLAIVGEAVGATDVSTCGDGEGNEARMERTFVGPTTVTVEGAEVAALRIVLVGSFTGKAQGTSRDELWFTPDTGLTLRWERTVDTLADAFGGAKVRYQEAATFTLESLTPSV